MLAVGLVLSAWFMVENGWILLMLGLLGHSTSLALFGLANLRARILPRFNFLPLVIGLLGGPLPLALSFLAGEDAEWPFRLLVSAIGLGWVALGGLLQFIPTRGPTR